MTSPHQHLSRSPYQRLIGRALAATPHADLDPRHVEACMRDAEPTGCLDHLDPATFALQARIAASHIAWERDHGTGLPEALARSYGL